MKIIFSENLLKSIPRERYKIVLGEINEFYNEYIEKNFNIRNMKHGWSVRRIKGTTNIEEIYKFRVNKSDRVLFTYGKYIGLRDGFLNSIVFLEFCNHDSQIIKGRNINLSSYIEKKFDEEIDNIYYDYKYEINTCISRVVTCNELTQMIEKDDERATYYLNDEQFDLISKDIKPLFLFGSAGSGKTTISVNKVYTLLNNHLKIGYFTYSENLVEESQKIFKNICDSDLKYNNLLNGRKVTFNCLNDYVLKKSQKTSIVNYEQFEKWAENILSKNISNNRFKLQPRDIFREIRGVIKGIVPVDWMNICVESKKLSIEFIEYLIENKYGIIKDESILIENSCLAMLNTKVENNTKLNKEQFRKDLKVIYSVIDDYIINNTIIDENIYLNLPKRYSIFTYEEKIMIYNIAKQYEQWLESNNKFDENDITRIALKKLSRSKEKFDYVICDEIQDLTELQIYFLLKIVNKKENILFCGDFNQTINPTFFDTGRVEAIYKIYNGMSNFKQSVMKKNYRSSKKIVKFSNSLTKLKISKLGKNKKNDYFESSVRDSNGNIRLIKNSINKEELLSLLRKRAYVDFIVSNDEEKQNLIRNSKNSKLVFTVSDYKGLENEYIIGYNIISNFKNKWQEILHKTEHSNDSELRYYFNLLYVLVTRARNNILLIEDDFDEELITYFKDDIEIVKEFDYKKLNLERISTKDEHYKKALRLEKNKQYIQAIESYKNADLNENELKREIGRCEALQKILEGNYDEGAKELFNLCEFKSAMNGYLKCENYLDSIKCGVLGKMSYEEIVNELSFVDLNIVDYILQYRNEITWYEEFEKIYMNYMNSKLNLLTQNVNSIIDTIENIGISNKGRV